MVGMIALLIAKEGSRANPARHPASGLAARAGPLPGYPRAGPVSGRDPGCRRDALLTHLCSSLGAPIVTARAGLHPATVRTVLYTGVPGERRLRALWQPQRSPGAGQSGGLRLDLERA